MYTGKHHLRPAAAAVWAIQLLLSLLCLLTAPCCCVACVFVCGVQLSATQAELLALRAEAEDLRHRLADGHAALNK